MVERQVLIGATLDTTVPVAGVDCLASLGRNWPTLIPVYRAGLSSPTATWAFPKSFGVRLTIGPGNTDVGSVRLEQEIVVLAQGSPALAFPRRDWRRVEARAEKTPEGHNSAYRGCLTLLLAACFDSQAREGRGRIP